MNLIFSRVGTNPTVDFAFRELSRILKKMDPTLQVDGRILDKASSHKEGILLLVEEEKGNDKIRMEITAGKGVIAGSSPRALLIAAYRFLTELGCHFLYPGESGEKIPQKKLDPKEITLSLSEQASYRHRAMCIEGAVSYRHVAQTIDFLPKVGMNGYFSQFHVPSTFFQRYYNDNPNPNLKLDPVTSGDVAEMMKSIEEEIFLRGLDYHATGHGWTCAPFGIDAGGWDKQTNDEMPPEALRVMAELNGERGLYKGIALNTNLCYSNPQVREKMNRAIVDYLKAHPKIDFLHFWLADGSNNHCECENCRKMLPSDYYVLLLNELDEMLTKEGIETKIVCLIYVDLLWEPKTEKIQNPDRFVLMFAPITRTYSNAFSDFDKSEKVELTPYKRNENVMPKSVGENLARLKKWQEEQLPGDSFDFDYHLMWDHILDPGYYECARILHKDMAGLASIGLNGMVSCQCQRTFFPTGLPVYAMAKALWNNKEPFEAVAKEYFAAAFGEKAQTVETYLSTLSRLFDPPYQRKEKPIDFASYEKKLDEAVALICAFEKEHLTEEKLVSEDLVFLSHHAKIVKEHVKLIKAYMEENSTEEKREAAKSAVLNSMFQSEEVIGDVFDPVVYRRYFNRTLKRFLPKE